MNLMQSILAIKEDVKDTQMKLQELIDNGNDILSTIELGSIKDGMYDKLVNFHNQHLSEFTTLVDDQIVSCKISIEGSVAKLKCCTPQRTIAPKYGDTYQQAQEEVYYYNDRFTSENSFEESLNELAIPIPEGTVLHDFWTMRSIITWDSSDDLQDFARDVRTGFLQNPGYVPGFIPELFLVSNLKDIIVAYRNDTQDTICSESLVSLSGEAIPIQEYLNALCDSSQLQEFMNLVCDCLSAGETNVTKISAILSNTANSYSPEVANMIQGFLSAVPTDNSQGIASALIGLYSNMGKTTSDEADTSLEFYQGNYLSSTLFASVWDLMYTAASAIVSVVGYVIHPIIGAAVTAVSQIISMTKQLSENEDFVVNETSMNRGFGVPIGQYEYPTSDRTHPFASHTVNYNAVCVSNPLFYYNAWTVGDKIRYEAFPVLLYSKASLKYILENDLGFSDNYSDAITRSNTYININRTIVWQHLFVLQDENAFQSASFADKLYILRATYALMLLLGNHTNYANKHVARFLPGNPGSEYGADHHIITIGESLNYFVNYDTGINTWNALYTRLNTYYSQAISDAIFNDKDSSVTDINNWYDDAYIENAPILSNPLAWFTGIMFDRNTFYVTPPKWQRGSIAWAIGIAVTVTALIIVTAISVKKTIRRKMRIKYAEITHAQSQLEESVGVASKQEINRMAKAIDKKTTKYNRIAGLFGYSRLSYVNGWESGDSGMVQNPNRFLTSYGTVNGSYQSIADVISLIK